MKPLRSAIMALVVVGLVLGLLWHHYHGAPPEEATWDDVAAEARDGGYRLITTGELADLCRQPPPGLLLVDTRSDWEYAGGHIRGAVSCPAHLSWPWGPRRTEKAVAALLGPDKDRPVVFY